MSTPPKTKAEFIAQIEKAKQAGAATIESMRQFQEIVEKLLADPATTPEVIALIEARVHQAQALLRANRAVERKIADLFFEHDLDALFAE